MNKIIFLIMALAIGAFGCSSMSDKAKQKRSGIVVYDSSKSKTAAGPIIKRDVKVSSGVMKLVNTTSADIEFRKGQPAVTIEGPENVIDKLEILEKGVTLNIGIKRDVRNVSLSKVKIIVSLPTVREITINGSGDLKADVLDSDALDVSIQGSGDVTIGSIAATSLKINVQGSGDVRINKIDCSNVQFLTQGSGDIEIKTALSTVLKTTIQGSGDIQVGSVEGSQIDAVVQGSGDTRFSNIIVTNLRVLSQGSGDVEVSGKASAASFTIQGTGDISARKLTCDRISKSKQGLGEFYR